MSKLRIGVNALYLLPGGVGGTETYLRSLLEALARIDPVNEYVLFTNRETGNSLVPGFRQFHVACQPVPARIRPVRILWEQLVLPVVCRRHELDVLFNPGFTAPAAASCPSVTVFHDLQHKRHPEFFRWFDLPFWRLFLYQSARTSRWLIAVSEATAADLERFYPFVRGRVRVIPHGVDPRCLEIARQRQDGSPEDIVLCVSTLHPHKNIPLLVRAFARFHRQYPSYRLVVAGLFGFDSAAVRRAIASCGLEQAVVLTGWIEREELYGWYRRARACVLPSCFEGFGMPLLEALAAGIPTACSNISPLRELAGEAALLFPPNDEQALVEALKVICNDGGLRARLAARGPLRARQFSWEETARQTLAVLRSAAEV